jgi:hypothetical protein
LWQPNDALQPVVVSSLILGFFLGFLRRVIDGSNPLGRSSRKSGNTAGKRLTLPRPRQSESLANAGAFVTFEVSSAARVTGVFPSQSSIGEISL